MSDADDPTETTPATAAVDAVDDGPGVGAVPDSVDPTTADPVRTVTRKGAAIGMAGALVVGGLLGWLGAGAFDDDAQPISAFQDGRFGEGPGPGGMPGGPGGGGFPGGPGGGGMPGGGHGPGGGWDGEGDHPVPPWMDEDSDDRRDDADEESEDDDEQDQSDGQDQPDDESDDQGESGN